MPPLLAVPNVSEGRDAGAASPTWRSAFSRGATLLDRHSDADHDRTVFTLAGAPGAAARGAGRRRRGGDRDDRHDAPTRALHPAIGALDVCPLVWLDPADRDAARTEAVAVAEQIGGLGVPVFLYGELASRPEHAERAYFRNGGLAELWLRMEAGELRPDFGPDAAAPHRRRHPGHRAPAARRLQRRARQRRPRARPRGRRRAARVRGRACPACGRSASPSASGRAQVSTNVHDPFAVPLARGGRAGARRWPRRSAPARVEAELVGLVPAAALGGYPGDVPMRGFDPARHDDRAAALAGQRRRSTRFTAMAQTKKKRRRKHRGTQGGRVDTNRRAARPRSRAEAKARARSGAANAPRAATRRRPGAARSSAASSRPSSSSSCCC